MVKEIRPKGNCLLRQMTISDIQFNDLFFMVRVANTKIEAVAFDNNKTCRTLHM